MIPLAFDGKHQTFSKAQLTGESLSKYVAAGKKARRRSREAVRDENQFTMLPKDTEVPF